MKLDDISILVTILCTACINKPHSTQEELETNIIMCPICRGTRKIPNLLTLFQIKELLDGYQSNGN